MTTAYAEFNTIPAFTMQAYKGWEMNDEALKWSGKSQPPAIGSKVEINFNGLGSGTVTGYFQEGGWLGLLVKLDSTPEWMVRQGKGGEKPVHVFGTEISPRN